MSVEPNPDRLMLAEAVIERLRAYLDGSASIDSVRSELMTYDRILNQPMSEAVYYPSDPELKA